MFFVGNGVPEVLVTGHLESLLEIKASEMVVVSKLMLGGEFESAYRDDLTLDFDCAYDVGESVNFEEVLGRHLHLVLLVRIRSLLFCPLLTQQILPPLAPLQPKLPPALCPTALKTSSGNSLLFHGIRSSTVAVL